MIRDYYVNNDECLCRRNGRNQEICIANFRPEVKKVIEYVDVSGKYIEYSYDISFYQGNDLICRENISLGQLKELDYSSLNHKLILNPALKTAALEMAAFIQENASRLTSEKSQLYAKLGWHKGQDGKYTYCAGDSVISSEGYCNARILPKLSEKYHLQTTDMTEQEAAEAALVHAAIEPPYSCVAFASALLGLIHQLVIDAKIRPPGVVYFVGDTQNRKTTLALMCCALYNRSALSNPDNVGISRVSSTTYRLEEEIDELRDATYIVDDLFRTNNRQERREYERRVRGIIRNYADNSSRQTARSEFKCDCQVIITAEYLLDTKTDIGRCFIVHVDHRIDSERLMRCQSQPLTLSTAFAYFIRWLCREYDRIVDDLQNRFLEFRKERHSYGYERTYEHAFLLGYVFELYCDYAASIDAISAQKSEETKNDFLRFLNDLIKKQNSIMSTVEKEEKHNFNFSSELEEFIYAEKPYKHHQEQCFWRGKYLYVTCNLFCRYLQQKYGNKISTKQVAKYFGDRLICKKDGERNVVKYGKSGKRFLALNIERLREDSGDQDYKIKDLFY